MRTAGRRLFLLAAVSMLPSGARSLLPRGLRGLGRAPAPAPRARLGAGSQLPVDELMSGFLARVDENNDMRGKTIAGDFVALRAAPEEEPIGYLKADVAEVVATYADVFAATDSGVVLSPALASVEDRTAAVGEVMASLRDEGHISGWRDELVTVAPSFDDAPSFLLERAALALVGARGYGVHVNGVVAGAAGGPPRLWVATRSADKQTWPGMKDHIVAGQQPYGLSPLENVVKECGEEAGIAAEVAAGAVPVGAVSYAAVNDRGELKRDALFCFDLALPESFTPRAVDGEVEAFELWDLDRVALAVAGLSGEDYKPNCNLVVIDFLLRTGYIRPEWPRYLTLAARLRSPGSR